MLRTLLLSLSLAFVGCHAHDHHDHHDTEVSEHGDDHSHGDDDHSHGDHEHSHGDDEHSHGDHGHSHGDHGHSHAPKAQPRPERVRLTPKAKPDDLRATIESAVEDHHFVRAVSLLEAYRAKNPRDLWVRLMLSDALVELGRIDEALEVLQTVLNVKPSSASYLRAAYLLHLTGQTETGLEVMDLALESQAGARSSDRAWALVERGDLFWHGGQLDRAAASYQQALVQDPRSTRARVGLARVAAARGDLATAERELGNAATTPALLGELALIQKARGRSAAAARTVRRAEAQSEREPGHWSRSLAVCLADQRMAGDTRVDTARAVALARKELRKRSGVHGLDALAWALVADGRYVEAVVAAERALAHGTREPLLLFHAGMAAARAGKTKRARAWLREALALNPDFHVSFAKLARETLDTLEA